MKLRARYHAGHLFVDRRFAICFGLLDQKLGLLRRRYSLWRCVSFHLHQWSDQRDL
jgi:hypothetical protein